MTITRIEYLYDLVNRRFRLAGAAPRAASYAVSGIPLVREAPVATGPGDQAAAGPDGHGRMRTSRADREQAIDTLKTAFVHGRLTRDELDERVARALVPLTHAELAALTDDLPAGLNPVAAPQQSGLAKAGAYVIVVAGLCMIAAIGNGSWNPVMVLGAVLFFSPVWLLALAGLLALHARLDRRPAGHRSARSGATRSAGPFGS